jgi:hypothetical protein
MIKLKNPNKQLRILVRMSNNVVKKKSWQRKLIFSNAQCYPLRIICSYFHLPFYKHETAHCSSMINVSVWEELNG